MTVETPAAPSRWLPSPARLAVLLVGLWLFGTGEAVIVSAGIGNSPWTVFAQGVGDHTGLSIGTVTIIVGAVALLAWAPLRQRPGLGTVCNVVLVGIAIDVGLDVLPRPRAFAVQLPMALAGVALIALASGLYLGAALGPGPRDGLMTGLHRVTGRSIAVCRVGLEGTVFLVGFLLGGDAGLGTLLFALLIGPSVQYALRVLSKVPSIAL